MCVRSLRGLIQREFLIREAHLVHKPTSEAGQPLHHSHCMLTGGKPDWFGSFKVNRTELARVVSCYPPLQRVEGLRSMAL